MLTYGEIERALAALHGVPLDQAAGKIRSRIKHFQRIGIVRESPGKGQKLTYEPLDAVRWALCLEFAQLATPPEIIKQILTAYGSALFGSFAGPMPEEDRIFWCRGNFFDPSKSPEGFENRMRRDQGIINVSRVANVFLKKPNAERVIMINLTRIKRELGKLLDIDWAQRSG